MIEVEILETRGLVPAMYGMRLSHQSQDKMDTVGDEMGKEDRDLALHLVTSGDDHGKWARMVISWLRVVAPRYWWQEFDTYRVGVEKQSGSTMHTLRSELSRASARDVRDYFTPQVGIVQIAAVCNLAAESADLSQIKANLPEGFLQERVVMLSLQALRRIYWQRKDHRLPEWQVFCGRILEQYPYPEFITAESVWAEKLSKARTEVAAEIARSSKAEQYARVLEETLRGIAETLNETSRDMILAALPQRDAT